MSTLIALRLRDTAVLATDSRIIDNSGQYVLSDSEQKIFEIATGRQGSQPVFYAWTGYRLLAAPQLQIATDLAKTADMKDLRKFADQVDAASKPMVAQLLSTLATIRGHNPTKYGEELSGAKPFHAYALAGLSNGIPGVLVREYWLLNGEIVHRETDGFNVAPGNDFTMYVTFGELLADVVPRPETWAKGPVAAVEGFVDRIRRGQPLVGGPTQLVSVDKSGARWVHRPVASTSAALDGVITESQLVTANLPVGVIYTGTLSASNITSGTITAAVSLTSPSLTISSGGTTININATDHIKLIASGYFQQVGTGISTAFGTENGFYVNSSASGVYTSMGSVNGLLVGTASGFSGNYSQINSSSVSVVGSGGTASTVIGQNSIQIDGLRVLSTRVPTTPATLSDVIAILQHHGLSN